MPNLYQDIFNRVISRRPENYFKFALLISKSIQRKADILIQLKYTSRQKIKNAQAVKKNIVLIRLYKT